MASKEDCDPLDIKFIGDIAARDMSTVAMREGIPWGADIDTYGLGASSYCLLFSSHIDVVQDFVSKRWRPIKPLRRHWNKKLWDTLFDTLLNSDGKNQNKFAGSHPNSLRALRKSFESYLDEGSRRKEVRSLLKQQNDILPKRR